MTAQPATKPAAYRPDQIAEWLALRAAGTPETIDTLYNEWPLMPAEVYKARSDEASAKAIAQPCISNLVWSQRYWTLYRRALAVDAAQAAAA